MSKEKHIERASEIVFACVQQGPSKHLIEMVAEALYEIELKAQSLAPNEPEVKAQGLKELAHPCKGTCSGWQQGFEAGQAAILSRAACGEFESWFVDVASQKAKDIVNRIENIANRPDLRETQLLQVKEILELVMEAYQESKAAKLKLPEGRRPIIGCDTKEDRLHSIGFADGFNACLDAVKSMNEGGR